MQVQVQVFGLDQAAKRSVVVQTEPRADGQAAAPLQEQAKAKAQAQVQPQAETPVPVPVLLLKCQAAYHELCLHGEAFPQ